MQNELPNFLIVGAAKSGTTSLYRYLSVHPEIFMSLNKEPLFFVRDIYKNLSRNDPRHNVADDKVASVASLEDYLHLFEDVSPAVKAIGEASTPYLYHYDMAIENIKKYLGNPKIIIILRNPVERAFSAYNHVFELKAESGSFEEFLKSEEHRKSENWDIINYPIGLGMYYKQVKAYQKNFSQVRVILLEDLKNNPNKVIRELCLFLGVSDDFTTDTKIIHNKNKHKISGAVRSSALAKLFVNENFVRTGKKMLSLILPKEEISSLGKKIRGVNSINPEMKPQTRQRLKKVFADDIRKLQSLIDQDLSHWL